MLEMWHSKLWKFLSNWKSFIFTNLESFCYFYDSYNLFPTYVNVMAIWIYFYLIFFSITEYYVPNFNFYVDFITIFLIINLLKFNILLNLMLK